MRLQLGCGRPRAPGGSRRGPGWLRHPTIGPALALGIATVAAPFFVMQPGMGMGVAASRAPRPAAARLQSLLTHAIFGAGLYATAAFVRFLTPGE